MRTRKETRKTMPSKGTTVVLRDGDDVSRALRKLKNKVEDAGTLKALQKKEFYEKPTTARKRKKAAGKDALSVALHCFSLQLSHRQFEA